MECVFSIGYLHQNLYDLQGLRKNICTGKGYFSYKFENVC
jgi:hypothetical protein